MKLTVADGAITDIAPNANHIGTKGFACMKGLHQHELYSSPDRLKTPLKRVGSDFVPVSWAEAMQDIGARVRKHRAISPHRIGMYVGTAAGFSLLHPIFAEGFMRGIGSRNIYSSATQDCANRFASATEMYGFPFHQPFPDLKHARYLLIVGTNPVVSKWTFLQVAHPVRQLQNISARGGQVVVIDPRRTETAKIADQHHFIRPGSDVFFFAAMLHEICARGAIRRDLASRYMTGFEALEDVVGPWTPERAAAVTGISATDLRALVSDYLAADGAAIVTGTGLGMGRFGTTAQWFADAITALTGNLDRDGGMMLGEGIFDFAAYAAREGLFARKTTSRIGGFRELNGGLPGAILADEILTPGDEQLRALFVTGGNPLLTMANSDRLKTAFEALDLLVVTDIYLNETASLATHVLPATSPLERPDLPFFFPLFLGMQSEPHIAATDAVIAPAGDARDEATIYTDLARSAGVSLFDKPVVQWALGLMLAACSLFRRRRSLPLGFILDRILKANGQPGFRALCKLPNGVPRPRAVPGRFLDGRITTDDGMLKLSTPSLLQEAEGLETAYDSLLAPGRPFRMISKRVHHTHNSWTQNSPTLTRGKGRATNAVYIHPDDAATLGVKAGAAVDIRSDTGVIRLPAALTKDLARGVVAVPHGWGHQHAKGLRVASSIQGANVNLLAADGPNSVETLSGMVHLSGIAVTLAPASVPVNPDSWSGL